MSLRLVDPPRAAAEQDRPRYVIGADVLDHLRCYPGTWMVVLADDDLSATAYARINAQAFRLRTRRKVAGGRVESRVRSAPSEFTVEARFVPALPVVPPTVAAGPAPSSIGSAIWHYGRVTTLDRSA